MKQGPERGIFSDLADYLRDHRRSLLLLALCAGVCGLVFWFYGIALGAVLYAFLLCLVLCAVWGLLRLADYRARRQAIRRAQEVWDLLEDQLPPPRGPLEADYQALARTLRRESGNRLDRAELGRREMTDYYAAWVHQIKTPIAAMHLLLRREMSSLSEELSAELLEVEQYVEMALGYLRLDSATTDFVFRDCQAEEVARRAVRRFAPQFIRRRITLDFQDFSLPVVTDEKWLLQCVEQLLSNALKYTPAGGRVTVSAQGRALVIRDTGIGIAPEDLPRVCEKGFTGYNGRVGQKSTGIGLYLCRRTLDRLGHPMRIESAPGQGTAVYIDLARQTGRWE